MTNLPSPLPDNHPAVPSTLADELPENLAPTVAQVTGVLRRSVWFMLTGAIVAVAAAAYYLSRQVPMYQARATIRIQSKEPNLPEIYRTFSSASEVSSELEVLASRTLVEDATRQLALQVRLTAPRGIARDSLLQEIRVAPDAVGGEYRLMLRPDGGFDAMIGKTPGRLGSVAPGKRLELPGVSFRLSPAAARHREIDVRVSSFASAVLQSKGEVMVSRVGRESDLLAVDAKDPDPGLVWQLPNAIIAHFMRRREENEKLQAASQVRFLRGQIDTLSVQLTQSEERLKRFRESARVVDPGEEATRQIDRLVSLESERSTMEAERSSLARLLQQVDSQQTRLRPGEQSPYRRLLAYPSLLQSQAASQLMNALTQVEEQRVTLLLRRTERDPEVQRLTARTAELEKQLGSIATTYLQGLTDQVRSRDSTIAQYNRELRALPGKQLEYARLERTPTVLKDMYTLLQTRLKEAEIAEAAKDVNVSVVDPAIAPRGPVSPRPKLVLIAALLGGLLFGLGCGALREFLDHTIRTRADVLTASGLPVLALIPHISRRGRKAALIATPRLPVRRRVQPPPQPITPPPPPAVPPPVTTRRSYTFLQDPEAPPEPTPAASAPAAPAGGPAAVVGAAVSSPAYQAGMTVSGPGSAIAEAYCILQTNIAFALPGETVKSLVLTSALPGEGKTTTAVNLALALTERGLSVLLVDADMRRGQVHQLLEIPRSPGLSELLQGGQTFEGARRLVQVGETRELAVLTAGHPASSPPALLESHRMGALLEHLKRIYDVVVIDSPPVNILTDAALLGRQVDGVLLVVRAGVSDVTAVGYAMRQLHHVRAPTLGAVLNDIDAKKNRQYEGTYLYASYAAKTGDEPDEG